MPHSDTACTAATHLDQLLVLRSTCPAGSGGRGCSSSRAADACAPALSGARCWASCCTRCLHWSLGHRGLHEQHARERQQNVMRGLYKERVTLTPSAYTTHQSSSCALFETKCIPTSSCCQDLLAMLQNNNADCILFFSKCTVKPTATISWQKEATEHCVQRRTISNGLLVSPAAR